MNEPILYVPREAEPEAAEQAVIVEIDQDGATRIRQCPPGVVVMVVERGEIGSENGQEEQHHQRKRSIAAGRRDGPHCGSGSEERRRNTEVSEITVQFPG